MRLRNQRVLVTGGAGFVGSHLADRLVLQNDVTVVDDLSNGDEEWVPREAEFVEGDLTDPYTVAGVLTDGFDVVFHLAASKQVNTDTPRVQFEENNAMTYNVLERMHEVGVTNLVFTSSSTVYGEAPRPTPEDFAPLEPISPYAASKLGEEGLLSTYVHTHGLTGWIFRFANVVGPRLRNAVIPDFIEKLTENPDELRILGDGRQEKSFMHVEECIDAMLYVVETVDSGLNTYNLGTRTTTAVDRVADIVAAELDVDPKFVHTGRDRGWDGDVPRMRLSIEKLSALGWTPSQTSDEAVRQTTRELIDELN